MQPESHFLELLSLKLAGEATEVQLHLLDNLISQNDNWRFVHDNLINNNNHEFSGKDEAERAYAAHIVKLQLLGKLDSYNTHHTPISVSSYFRKKWLVAATIFFAIAAGSLSFLFYNNASKSNNHLLAKTTNEVSTKKGSKSNVRLPDGTQVWLNADSKISYKNDEINNCREVILTGEAFFDVVHDSTKPFIIHTGDINIKVLGTAFNVRNYSNEGKIETSLIRGKIELTVNNRPGQKFLLNPYEKLIVQNTAVKQKDAIHSANSGVSIAISPILPKKDSVLAETGWLKDQLIFTNQPLEEIAFELERNYNIKIIFSDKEAKAYRYTASFNHVGVNKILGMLSLSKKINFKITDSVITISK